MIGFVLATCGTVLLYCGLSENYSVHNNLVCGENALVEAVEVLDSLAHLEIKPFAHNSTSGI